MARCIFHIDLDAFFVSVEQALNPKLKGKPVIVGGDPERRGVVASASYEARPFGIHAGMPLSKARRLCPQAIFVRANFSRYRDASNRFMEILADFSPDIEPLGVDEAYLDVTGCVEPYDSPQKLARAIKEIINKDLKLTASVGIGTCKVVAKIASALCKPDGLLEIAPGEEQAFLNPLPIAKLPGVGEKTEQSLKELGITTIGELASLPLDTLTRRLGATGAVLYSYARGIDDREVEAPGEAKSISQQLTFARDTLDRNFLEANLHNLCQEVCQELRSQNKRAKCVAIRLRYADFKTITRQVTLQEASDVTQVVFATAQQLLSKTLAKQEKPIRLIGIRISSLAGEEKQLPMFDPRVAKFGQLDQAVDKIRKKYGQTAIKSGDAILSESS
ncbi:MAG: DNA polymerase IV [Dehalococcoidia bacterium]